MLTNYLKVALRNIFRNKLTAFINIGGLALSMTCALMIYLYIADEISYDRYHKNADRTYRITRDFLSPDGTTNLRLANVAPPIGPLVKNDFGEIEVMARTINFGFVIGLEENGELKKVFNEDYLFVAEPEIFKIFDVDFLSGNPSTSLEKPFTVMLSEKTAKRYFNDTNVLGKRLRAGNQYDLEVTGVYKDFPKQSHWHPELLVSFNTLNDTAVYGRKGLETNWGNNSFGTYILLEKGASPEKLEAQLPDFLNKHFGPYAIAQWGAPPDFVASRSTRLWVQKVTDIHLKSKRDDELEANGDLNSVYLMGVIGIFIVLIACFNFINLSTAHATKRAKDVGMRKVVGALKNQLVTQYLSESVLIAFFALLFSIAMSSLVIVWLNDFTNKELSLDFIGNWPMGLSLIGFTVFVGLLAGIYPSFIISSYKPALVLKGQQSSAGGKGTLRKGLVIFQFAISIALMIVTAITYQQLNFLSNRDLGYDKNKVVTLRHYNELNETYNGFYNELTKSSLIKNVSRSTLIPTNRLLNSSGPPMITKGDSLINSSIETKLVFSDAEFFKTYNIEMIAGRDFDKARVTDDSLAFIVNETAAREYGWTDLNAAIDKDFNYDGTKGKLIGIVKDFHFESLHQRIVPIVFYQQPGDYNDLSVKIAGDNFEEGIAHLEKVWKEFLPNRPFDFQFLSDRYERLYEAEQKQSQLFTIFSGLAIFIACLGLFGLAVFSTLQRIKEIGVRKVLGASVVSILALLSKEIILLILIANVIAWPMAWYTMREWLGTFAYHVDMSLVVFILSALMAVLIALFTIGSQTIKAGMTNPANILRSE
jgi:putative ABC transport system permease protein